MPPKKSNCDNNSRYAVTEATVQVLHFTPNDQEGRKECIQASGKDRGAHGGQVACPQPPGGRVVAVKAWMPHSKGRNSRWSIYSGSDPPSLGFSMHPCDFRGQADRLKGSRERLQADVCYPAQRFPLNVEGALAVYTRCHELF